MNEYTSNQYQDNYAEESKRNILETPRGRMKIGMLEARFESLMNEIIEEEFSDE